MAMLAWQDVFDSANFVREHDSQVSETMFNCIAAGMVTLYARPFGSNNGVGAISKDFRSFPGDVLGRKLESYHLYMLLLRDKVFAHFDLPANTLHMSKIDGAKSPESIDLWLSKSGFVLSCPMLLLGRPQLEDVVSLVSFQRRRLQIQLEKALHGYFDGKVPLGHFVIANDGIKKAESEADHEATRRNPC